MTRDTETALKRELARIADALEAIAAKMAMPALPPLPPAPPAPIPTPIPNFNGWRCGYCGTWVLPGVSHACSGKTFTGGGYDPKFHGGASSQTQPGTFTVWNFPIAGTVVGHTIT